MTRKTDHSASVRELLEDLDLFRLPVVPKEVCRRLGIEYREYRYEGPEGTLVVLGKNQLIGVNANTKEPSRKAFTCAHELGHYYFDLDDGGQCAACTEADVLDPVSASPRELRANAFAAELLMPQALFEPLIQSEKPSWELITKLAELCGTSMQATAQRYVELSPYGCWLAVLRNGKVHRYQKHPGTEAHLNTQRPILMPEIPSTAWQSAPAHVWMGKGRYTKNRSLYQSFLRQNQYGETLVLLWDRHSQFHRDGFIWRTLTKVAKAATQWARKAN